MTNNELCHFGIQGQRWGRRRWQYDDGRFNEAGKERYFSSSGAKTQVDHQGRSIKKNSRSHEKQHINGNSSRDDNPTNSKSNKKLKYAAIGAAVAVGIVGGIYGAKKYNEYIDNANMQAHIFAAIQKLDDDDKKFEKAKANAIQRAFNSYGKTNSPEEFRDRAAKVKAAQEAVIKRYKRGDGYNRQDRLAQEINKAKIRSQLDSRETKKRHIKNMKLTRYSKEQNNYKMIMDGAYKKDSTGALMVDMQKIKQSNPELYKKLVKKAYSRR